ncbi:MAG: phosphonopyruvate decarboxylase [Lachnospiraceae bacterium]|nr:phosphonopyruvate decarboxylase [Lachnospiraceae bacterium]
MQAKELIELSGASFFAGVPDSQLKALCDTLYEMYGTDPAHHVICANEGNACALAAGCHLATGQVPVVYMQNSGEGNIINPAASLLSDRVYGIPVLFIVGWRGEPGVHDEPQHIFQGEVTVKLLEDMEIASFVIGKETTTEQAAEVMTGFRTLFEKGKSAAFVVRKGALSADAAVGYTNTHTLLREDAIRTILAETGDDAVIATTGKAGREVYELRDAAGQTHAHDFLTVGSMGHCSSVALGLAIAKPEKRFWCIDGDGAALMHLGALPVIASCHPDNLIHIVINNGAHESVGGQPTVMGGRSVAEIAAACGYPKTVRVADEEALADAVRKAKEAHTLTLIEVCCAIGSRADLGRPKTSAMENKHAFMEML